ncbi:epsilon-sarcoglycan isoform X1 [Harpegnathos saltator]|uniref:epsilon-sarcoglycan isoform X1 n=2 Tax=Harpegnathos saltator TaxID=610380 RepID=UPI000DBEDCA4|nr:epsilon-sarcoglycan isoform X1 [Harpegnathos saltator]
MKSHKDKTREARLPITYGPENAICVVGSDVPAAHVNEEATAGPGPGPPMLRLGCRLFSPATHRQSGRRIPSRVGDSGPTGNGPPSSVARASNPFAPVESRSIRARASLSGSYRERALTGGLRRAIRVALTRSPRRRRLRRSRQPDFREHHGTIMHPSVILLSASATFVAAESILMTEVFVIPIKPETFDWSTDGHTDQFSYQPSLLNAPDLPSWIHYTYSKKDHHGFLYGVAPKNQKDFQLEVVGLNRHTYETRYKVLDINVLERENLTKYEVYLKIDNLNVEDMFDHNRTEKLLDIFRKKLWKAAVDLYVTFLASAIDLGARLPLKPSEGEGVVMRLGSTVPFSQELIELQEEVKPLEKMPSCPRDFKRTSVEILFRESQFNLDWCSFRLREEDQQSLQHESARRGPSVNDAGLSSGISEHTVWRWARAIKASMPTRSYLKDTAITVFMPVILLFVLNVLLGTSICVHHDSMERRECTPVEGVGNNGIQMVQYAMPERGTLKSLSDQPPSSKDSMSRGPRVYDEHCNSYVRPNPPPYTGPCNSAGLRTDF